MDVRHVQILLCLYRNDSPGLHSLIHSGLLSIDEPLTRDYKTALHWSVLLHRLEATVALLALGAQSDIADYEGFTPLMCAVAQASETGNIQARLLMCYGADPKFATKLTGFDSALDMAEASFSSNPALYIHMKEEESTKEVWSRRRSALYARLSLRKLTLV